ncbi:MAG: flagellar biosynthetic protein FliO [Desulfovibrionaceae bacterium]|nr:flagellar biosynthetic protein FliO [Desulfovibrionaceae bacterium]
MADESDFAASGPLPHDGAASPGAGPLTTPALRAQRQTTESVGLPDGPVPDSGFTWGAYFQAIGILILLLCVLWFALRMLRRVGGGRFLPATTTLPRQSLRVEAHLPLGQHRGVFVVRFLNKRLLVGVTEQNITLLSEMDARDDQNNNQDFHSVMESARHKDASGGGCRASDAASDSGPGGSRA